MKKFLFLLVTLLMVSAGLVLAEGTPEPEQPAGEVMEATVDTTSSMPELKGNQQVVYYNTLADYEKATGRALSEFNEAPELARKVAAGQLDSLDQRLTNYPLVIMPADEIGEYGGTIRTAHFGNIDFLEDLLREFPLMYSSDVSEILPNYFKTWEIMDGAKIFVFHMREDIKWSDGHPFTVDDFVFWYEDVVLNKDLRPGGVGAFKVAGESGKIEKIDDYTMKWSFVAPYGVIFERLCRWRPMPHLPAHYLKQFHANYVSKADIDKLVKAGSFSSWVDLFEDERYYVNNSQTPSIAAWTILNEFSGQSVDLQRNPYYWKVDAAGNQLPYADKVQMLNAGNREAYVLKTVAGEVDYAHHWELGHDANYPLVLDNLERSNIRIVPKVAAGLNTVGGVIFNMSHEDPVLRKLFNDKQFRIAMSVAINREQINQIVFRGVYKINSIPGPPIGPPHHGEQEMFHIYEAFDLDQANKILDEIGLKWDSDHNWRLRSDGKPLNLVANVHTGWAQQVPIAEMYKQYWAEIGINLTIKPMGGGLYGEQRNASKHDIGITALAAGGNRPFISGTRGFMPSSPNWDFNPKWGAWLWSDGKNGEEPPQDVKRLYQLYWDFAAEPDADKRTEIEKEMYLIHSDNFWAFCAVKTPSDLRAFHYFVFHNRMRNIPVPMGGDYYYAVPSQWYIKE